MRRQREPSLATVALAASLLVGCSVPIAGALDETQANRVVVALGHVGVVSEKEADPTSEGHFRVVVPREEAPRAIAALREEELPPESAPGVLDALGKGSIVPSPLAEHAQYVAGLGGELERTLAEVDGVLSARVHLSLPERDPLADGPPQKATASVMLKHRGATPPIEASGVARLVAGAAPGLSPADVSVLMIARPMPAGSADRDLARLGPIAVSRGSMGSLRAALGIAIALCVALVAGILVLWSQVRRLKAAADGDQAPEPGR